MRIHTALTRADIAAIPLPAGVAFHHLREHGSRSRPRAFEVVLTGSSNYGGQWGHQDYAAATWDEWGVFLGYLFEWDPLARIAGVYADAADFHWQTGHRFVAGRMPLALCKRHRFRPFEPYVQQCTKPGCSAMRRWHLPQRLAQLVDAAAPWPVSVDGSCGLLDLPPAALPWTPTNRHAQKAS